MIDFSLTISLVTLTNKIYKNSIDFSTFSFKLISLQVSWIRHKDIHLLTVGKLTYSSDIRYQTVHYPQTEDWTLQVNEGIF